jgi:hypothetical protein
MALTRKNQHIAATPVKVTATHDQRYMCLLAVPIPQKQNSSGVAKLGRGYWLISLMGYWGIGVLGYWGIGVLVMLAPTSATALPKNCDKNFCTVGICVSSSIDHDP